MRRCAITMRSRSLSHDPITLAPTITGLLFTDDGDHNGNWFTETSDHDHSGKIQQSTDHDRSIIDHALLAIG